MDCSEVSHLLFTKNRLQPLKLSALHFILTAAECQGAEGLRGCREKRAVSHPETQATLVGAQSRESPGAGEEGERAHRRPGARSRTGWGAQSRVCTGTGLQGARAHRSPWSSVLHRLGGPERSLGHGRKEEMFTE